MKRVLVSEQLADSGLEAMRAAGLEVDVRLGLSPSELLDAVKGAAALVIRSATQVTAEVLEAADELVVVGRAGIGLDNVDVGAATCRGVMVVNAPQSNVLSAAEHTIALLLAQARNIPQADRDLRNGEWNRTRWEGVELHNKTLGIVGLGRVGVLVAQPRNTFGMQLVAYDPYVSAERARQLGVDRVSTVEELVRRSDFLTVHLPKTPDTIGLISAELLTHAKPTLRIVNTARGGIVPRPLPLSFAPGWRPWSRCATTTIRSSGHSVPRRTPLTFQEWTVGITLSTTSRARACSRADGMEEQSAVDRGHAGDRDLIVEEPPRQVPVPGLHRHSVRPGQWMDHDHRRRAPGGRQRNERPEPETRVAEAQLLHDGDLPLDVETLVVGLLACADEHELALDAAVRRRGREVRRDDLEGAAVGELELRDVVPVAERRELTVLDLEAELPELAPDVVGRPGVPFRADEAVPDADEPLDARDRPGPADSRPQLQFGRREHERDRIADPSDPSSRANRV